MCVCVCRVKCSLSHFTLTKHFLFTSFVLRLTSLAQNQSLREIYQDDGTMQQTWTSSPKRLNMYMCVWTVMNLDRVENHTHVRRRFPRYHTTMFRGQSLWDPYTHVILPPTALAPQRQQQQQQHSWKEKERTERERKNRPTDWKGSRDETTVWWWCSQTSVHFSLPTAERRSRAGQHLGQSDGRAHCSQTLCPTPWAAHHHCHPADLSKSGCSPASQVPHGPTRSEVGISSTQSNKNVTRAALAALRRKMGSVRECGGFSSSKMCCVCRKGFKLSLD